MNSHLSPQIIEHKKDHDVVLEIQILSWIRDNNVAVLNCLMGSHPSHSDNWISNSNTDKRPVLIRLISKRQHTHKNEQQHKHKQYNSRVSECS
jgi:hypothetical protein